MHNLGYTVETINAIINVLKFDDEIEKHNTRVAYCFKCDVYMILKKDVDELRNIGIVLCQLNNVKNYNNSNKRENTCNYDSVLKCAGYSASKDGNLTIEQRTLILGMIVENNILSVIQICNHLDFMIQLHRTSYNMAEDLKRWNVDREYEKI